MSLLRDTFTVCSVRVCTIERQNWIVIELALIRCQIRKGAVFSLPSKAWEISTSSPFKSDLYITLARKVCLQWLRVPTRLTQKSWRILFIPHRACKLAGLGKEDVGQSVSDARFRRLDVSVGGNRGKWTLEESKK